MSLGPKIKGPNDNKYVFYISWSLIFMIRTPYQIQFVDIPGVETRSALLALRMNSWNAHTKVNMELWRFFVVSFNNLFNKQLCCVTLRYIVYDCVVWVDEWMDGWVHASMK